MKRERHDGPRAHEVASGGAAGRQRRSWSRLAASLVALAAVAALLLGALPARAQAKKQRVIRLDAITVEGRIQKPQAIYILQRSILNFAELERTESFLPKVVQSVDKGCF